MGANVITVSNPLGGTGKTTIAFHLAHGLADLGYKVLTLDLDPKASLTRNFGVKRELITFSARDLLTRGATWWKTVIFVKQGLYLIPATDELAGMDYHLLSQPFSYMKLKKKLRPACGEHDFIIIDTAPAFNLFSVNAWNISDTVLMPFIPGPNTIQDIETIVRDFADFEVDIQVVFNQVGRDRSAIDTIASVVKKFGSVRTNPVRIPRSRLVPDAMFEHEPVFNRYPGTRSADALKSLVTLVSSRKHHQV